MDNKYNFENIVLEGGGVRGYAYCGVLYKLMKMGVLDNVKRYAGTSVGSLFATLLLLGFNEDEIMNIKDEVDFSSVITNKFNPRYLYGIWRNYGVNSLSIFEKQFVKIISRKVDPNITLKELFELTNKELVIVTCCLNREKAVYLHHSKFPNAKLIDCLLVSMSVPIIIKPRAYNFLGTNDFYVDGGVLNNYPIWIFNDIPKLYTGKIHTIDRSHISSKTLGLKLLTNSENEKGFFKSRNNINNIFDIIMGLVNTMMMNMEEDDISKSYINQTIAIHDGGIKSMEFNISKDKINALIQNGMDAVDLYFGCLDDTYYIVEDDTDQIENENTDQVVDENNDQVVDENTDQVVDENNDQVVDENTDQVVDENNDQVEDENNDQVEDNNTDQVEDNNTDQVEVVDENNDQVEVVDENNNQVEDNNTDQVVDENNDQVEDNNTDQVEDNLS